MRLGNFNMDENTMNNIKNMVDNGIISDAISQISPEMLQNFFKKCFLVQIQKILKNLLEHKNFSNSSSANKNTNTTSNDSGFDFTLILI